MTSRKSSRQQEISRIMDVLTRAIAQHQLPPGTRLIEAQLMEALDANRNHVQAALQRLSLQNIVTIEPNRGGRVAKPTEKEARDVFSARRAIERAIVESITPQAIENHRSVIEAHQAAEFTAIEAKDRRTIVHELIEFHRLLAHICSNDVLKEMLESLLVRSSIIVALYQKNDVPTCQHDEHREILDALEQGDSELAARKMEEHLLHLEGELALDEGGEEELDIVQVLNALR